MGLLERFSRALFPIRETEAQVASLQEEEVRHLISPHIIAHQSEKIVALLPYKHPVVSALIIETKYHRNTRAAALLGKILSVYLDEYVTEQDTHEPRNYILVPIPLSKERTRERGYNQTEHIAQAALTSLHLEGTPATELLTRVRNTESQTHLTRAARLENLKGAFSASTLDPSPIYLLIDDVVTTGATFTAGAKALRDAGATDIVCVGLAH